MTRVRREPPPFRRVSVARTRALSPHMVRVTLAGPALEGLTIDEPAASVRVLVPSASHELILPRWTGNEFLMPDGRRPPIRTFTPRALDADALELEIDVVLHEGGVASEWASRTGPGEPAALSGPGRGYVIDPDASGYLLGGDETAIPAISQLLEALPGHEPVAVYLEVARPDARIELPGHPLATVVWCDLPRGSPPGDALVAAVCGADLPPPGGRVWVAGEAAAVQRIRRCLFEERGVSRSMTSIRGYWKYGRAGDTVGDS
jgi:NADPH-dependent ferric siderophore reductase